MAFAGQISLSSSPSRVATPLPRSISPLLSSPLLPSPSQLFATKFAKVKGVEFSNANSNDIVWAEVGATAITNTIPVGGNLRDGVNSIEELEEMDRIGATKRKNPESRKSQASGEERGISQKKPAGCKTVKQKRGSKSTVVAESSEDLNQTDLSAKQDVGKKSMTKPKGKSQSKIEGRRITKPGVTRVSVNKKRKPTSSTIKPPQGDTAPTDSSKQKAKTLVAREAPLDLLLAEAVRRRKAWTPPKDTPQEALDLRKLGTELDETLALEGTEPRKAASGGFENLLDDFGYAGKGEGSLMTSDHSRNMHGEAVTKRRKIELVNLAPLAQARIGKLPKKKPQTVTGKATAPFLPAEQVTPSLLQYLETELPSGNQETHIENPEIQISTSDEVRRRSRPKKLTQFSSAKSKTKPKHSPVLHSPQTAIKSVNEQELIFGTSSQLAREESPTCLRDIQQAIINSQQMCEENSMSSAGDITPKLSCNLLGRAGATPLVGSKNLWSVASRGLDGSLLTVEVIDLVDTPRQPTKKPSVVKSETNEMSNMEAVKDCAAEVGPLNVLLAGVDTLQTSKRPVPSKQNDLALEQPIPRSLAEASLRARRQSRSPVKKPKVPKDSGVPVMKEMPNYQGFTDADLCKEIASFGFKAIKKRKEMIALLERCWESQARIALQTLQPNLKAVTPRASHEDQSIHNKPSKRKVKQQESTTAGATSNVASSAPKPRGRPRKTPASPPPSLPEPVPIPCLAPPIPNSLSSLETDMFTQITNAINAAPATHSATHPTFRERMLLYDPIVLEDLTAWLNTEGLGMVGVDEEVSIGVVKEWCQKKSVCCHSRNESSTARR